MIFQNEYEKELYDRYPSDKRPPDPLPAQRETFTIPPGHEALRDTEGRAIGVIRAFATGAIRDTDKGKLDYEGFLSPLVLKRYAEHMHAARKMADGTMRESDNWQMGIETDVYMKSMWRHFFAVWKTHRGWDTDDIEAELCALIFNASGMLHEILKSKRNA